MTPRTEDRVVHLIGGLLCCLLGGLFAFLAFVVLGLLLPAPWADRTAFALFGALACWGVRR